MDQILEVLCSTYFCKIASSRGLRVPPTAGSCSPSAILRLSFWTWYPYETWDPSVHLQAWKVCCIPSFYRPPLHGDGQNSVVLTWRNFSLVQSGSKHTSKRSWIPWESFEADISPVIDCTTTAWWALLKEGRTQEKLLHPAATEHYWKYRLGEAPYRKEFMKGEPKRKGYIQLIPNPVHQNRSGRAPATKIPKLVPKPHPKVLIRIILFFRSPQLLLHRIQIIIITALCSSYRVLCFQSQEPHRPLLEPSSSLVFLPRERWRRSKLFAATVLRSAPWAARCFGSTLPSSRSPVSFSRASRLLMLFWADCSRLASVAMRRWGEEAAILLHAADEQDRSVCGLQGEIPCSYRSVLLACYCDALGRRMIVFDIPICRWKQRTRGSTRSGTAAAYCFHGARAM